MPDRLTATNEKGYRMVRASFGVSEGVWYYEIDILPHNGNVRLGWCTEKGDVQAPVGYDKYSYSYRDKEGTKFHESRGKPYGEPYSNFFFTIILIILFSRPWRYYWLSNLFAI